MSRTVPLAFHAVTPAAETDIVWVVLVGLLAVPKVELDPSFTPLEKSIALLAVLNIPILTALSKLPEADVAILTPAGGEPLPPPWLEEVPA